MSWGDKIKNETNQIIVNVDKRIGAIRKIVIRRRTD